jgi:hypothetical protein
VQKGGNIRRSGVSTNPVIGGNKRGGSRLRNGVGITGWVPPGGTGDNTTPIHNAVSPGKTTPVFEYNTGGTNGVGIAGGTGDNTTPIHNAVLPGKTTPVFEYNTGGTNGVGIAGGTGSEQRGWFCTHYTTPIQNAVPPEGGLCRCLSTHVVGGSKNTRCTINVLIRSAH